MKKYPRTPHLSFSPGYTNDDIILNCETYFGNQEIVVSEKLDGEVTGMTCERYHARSLDSKDHSSRHWVKQLWGQIRHQIPKGWKIFGENVFARHSIFYNRLTTYFYVFSIIDDDAKFLSWDDTVEWAGLLSLQTVPVFYEGAWDESKVKSFWPCQSAFGDVCEGYVVRTRSGFAYNNFGLHVCKFVRANHVQTSEFWMSEAVVPNQLIT